MSKALRFLACMPGMNVISNTTPEEFNESMSEHLGCTVKYLTEIKTNPTPGEEGTGGRNDAFFWVEPEDEAQHEQATFKMMMMTMLSGGEMVVSPASAIPQDALFLYKGTAVESLLPCE